MPPKEIALEMADWERAGAKDKTAFEALVVQHQRQVMRTALRLLGNLDDAKDAAQEVFYRLYKYRGSMEGAWLYRVTVNVCRDLRRKQRDLPMHEAGEPADEAPLPDFGMELAARRDLVRLALKRLPEREQEAVVLHDIEGLTTREVAEAMETSEATVRSQLSTGRARLRDLCAAMLARKKS